MRPVRLLRIAATAAGLIFLFILSQGLTLAREGQRPPGLAAALGALSLLFLMRAAVTERVRGPEASLEKDLLWGLAIGGCGAAVSLVL